MKSATVVTSGNATIGGKLAVNNNATDALTVTGKARSASTISTDVGTTLVTKDYMQAQIDASAGGTITATQTGGNNTDPNLTLTLPQQSSSVQVVGGTGISSTRNANNKITLGFNGFLIAEATAGNNTDPTITLGGTDNPDRKVTVRGGTGIQVDRNTNSQITVTNAGTIKAVQTGGNNANPNIQISSNQAAKNVQLSGGAGIDINRTSDSDITVAVSNDRSPWEVHNGTIRPVTGSQNVVPRSHGNASLGANNLSWDRLYVKSHVIGDGGDSATSPTYTWAGQQSQAGMYLVANGEVGITTGAQLTLHCRSNGVTEFRSNITPKTTKVGNVGSHLLLWNEGWFDKVHAETYTNSKGVTVKSAPGFNLVFDTGNANSDYMFRKNSQTFGAVLRPNTLTTNRFYTFPDKTGTFAMTSDVPLAGAGLKDAYAGTTLYHEVKPDGTSISVSNAGIKVNTAYLDTLYEPIGSSGGIAAGQWEISGTNLRPVAGADGKDVVPRANANANLGVSNNRWDVTYTNKVSANSTSSPTAPSYTWGGQESVCGMYLAGNQQLGLATGGQESLRIYADGSATMRSNFQPQTDGGANLGSPTLRWQNVYTQDMHFSNEGTEGNSVDGTTGDWTLQEGHDYLYFINNKTGVKFRVVMEQV